ncbi:amino acid synthesis family protein [Methylibium sp. Root1272]|uniref:amino acid synthesis family protein n=1 Tax=Methylibium sp. Root1272 TaxID=1736441 RepID=UPI0007000FA1|nr:hypothetical protein ASC67_19970 [Methylibium sp. Root1272]
MLSAETAAGKYPVETIVMPVTNKNSIWNFDDMDGAEIAIADAPRPDEMLIALVLAIGGRPLHRVRKPA